MDMTHDPGPEPGSLSDRLDEFAYHTVIDELIYLLDKGESIRRIRHGALDKDRVDIIYQLDSGETYEIAIPAGCFRETWEEAATLLADFYDELKCDPLAPLSTEFC